MTFQIHALPAENFAPLFKLSDEDLARRKARRVTATNSPGFPCRVSLRDAVIGETVILVNHQHQPADGPYRSSHAIYVAMGAAQATLATGEAPDMLRRRVLSLRLFDAEDLIVDAEVLDGGGLADALNAAFTREEVAYAHIHFAARGCFAARATRAAG